MSTVVRRPPTFGARAGMAIAIVIVFVVVGPPIGFLTILIASSPSDAIEMLTTVWSPPYFLVLIGGIAMSYVFGGGPLALAGLVVGIKQAYFGPSSWWMALATGLVIGVAGLGGVHLQFADFPSSNFSLTPAVLILSGVVPTLVCWLLVSGWYFAPPAHTEATP